MSPEFAEVEAVLFVDPSRLDAVVAALEADPRIADYRVLGAANTRGDYYDRYEGVAKVDAVWDDGADLRSIALALATTEDIDSVLDGLAEIDGVLAAVDAANSPRPEGPDAPSTTDVEDEADAAPKTAPEAGSDGDAAPTDEPAFDTVVVDSQEVAFSPTAVTCDPGLVGVTGPPNEIIAVAEPLDAPSAREAFRRFLDENPNKPPWIGGYVELIEEDGSISFGFADEPERYLTIVRVEQRDVDGAEQWRVTEWEIVGC